MRSKYIVLLLLINYWFISCHSNKQEIPVVSFIDTGIKYAKRFSIQEKNGLTYVYVFGNKQNRDTTSTFILYTDLNAPIPQKNQKAIHVPCQKIAALSSIYARMFYELGALDKVAAIDNIDYVSCEAILRKHAHDSLKEISKGVEIDLEQTIVLQPDIIFSFGMGEWEKDRNKKIERLNIPLALSIDHLEQGPLARAEWIKFFAAFIQKGKMADSIFNEVEKRYLELQELGKNFKVRPSVFNELKYSDSWYMPGGKSYVAELLHDAGANYLWKENESTGSVPLTFEQVYSVAKNADFWINLSTLHTKRELLSYESRYSEFKAFKSGQLYNNNLHTNAIGYSVYWETGMIYPDRILCDFIRIFHPETINTLGSELNYYQRLP